jgi:hypothetical protein
VRRPFEAAASIQETKGYDHSTGQSDANTQELACHHRNFTRAIGSMLSPVENIDFSFDKQTFSSLS